ncbi:MAG: aldehyde ferredoxin oxidoreductase N-terminal domain-containing protein, partial [Candidatus Hydrothermarchaeales archaeon]
LAPASGRTAVVSKSPATGTLFDSNIGGHWGVELKKAGYDGIIVEGRAEKPVRIAISDAETRIKDASELWGRSTGDTASSLRKKGKVRVLCIGPAGENLVKFAGIMDDEHRAAGRGGLGAVMGSKNLKAITVFGTQRIKPANEYAFKEHYKKLLGILKGRRQAISGSPGWKKACATCPIACRGVMKSGKNHVQKHESAWVFGPHFGLADPEAIARANHLCNELGLDSISMGDALAFNLQASDKELFDDITGNPNVVLKLIEDTAHRRDLGELLAEGNKNVLSKTEYSNPKLKDGVKILKPREDDSAVLDSLPLCKFTSSAIEFEGGLLVELLTAATDLPFENGELKLVGERIIKLEKLFNVREAFPKPVQ